MSPFPNYLSMESVCKEMEHALGKAYRMCISFFRENMFYVFFEKEDFDVVGEHAFKQVNKNPRFFHTIVTIVDKSGKAFVAYLKALSKKDLTKLSDEKIADIHRSYEKRYKHIYSHYFTILAAERILTEYLKQHLREKLKDDMLVEECFSTLITEPRAQVNTRENVSALTIAASIEKNTRWKSYFSSDDPAAIEEKIRKDKALNRLFLTNEKAYFWITRDYEDPVLTYRHFIERMVVLLKDKPVQQLKEKRQMLKDVPKHIKEVERKAHLNSHHKALFAAMREGLHLKELRKAYVSQSLYYYDAVLHEIARRSNCSLREVRHLKTEEVPRVFHDKRLQKELAARVKLSVYWIEKGKTSVYTGKEAESLYKKLCIASSDIKELHGIAASPGKVTGPVRIVMHPHEMHKVKEGDIIVTGQIVPAFAPALKKAKGLVCDGGTGITSHPAILAREAKIPCVTLTKIATQLLKDDDIIEVDGSKGMVRRIKR